jgi:hypothetical protein
MRLAIVDDNDQIYVEYDVEVFRKLLIKNLETMPFNEAFNYVIASLKELTLRK